MGEGVEDDVTAAAMMKILFSDRQNILPLFFPSPLKKSSFSQRLLAAPDAAATTLLLILDFDDGNAAAERILS